MPIEILRIEVQGCFREVTQLIEPSGQVSFSILLTRVCPFGEFLVHHQKPVVRAPEKRGRSRLSLPVHCGAQSRAFLRVIGSL